MERNITKEDLVKIAKKEGLKNYSKLKKKELIRNILKNKNITDLKELARDNGVKIGKNKKELVSNLFLFFTTKPEKVKITKGGIPKVIHQIWVGGKIPALQGLYSNTWKDMKGYNYRLWGNRDLTKKNFPITWEYIQKALEIGRTKYGNVKRKYAQVADLMRLEILYRYGGVYVDSAMESLKNLDGLIDKKSYSFLVANEDPCGWNCRGKGGKKYISNGFFASSPKHPILKKLLSEKNLNSINLESIHANVETGPYYFGKIIRKSAGAKMLPTTAIYPASGNDDYRSDPDKCFFWGDDEGEYNIELSRGDETLYLQYPCKSHPESYVIEHWDVGGTWRHDMKQVHN
jgi:mannosyltransferase OCH1-like enzyme